MSRTQTRSLTLFSSAAAALNTANQLTLLRIILVPIFIIMLSDGKAGWALSIFVAAGLTDVLDGVIARRFGQKTSIGAVLDPLADKLMMTTSVIILTLPQMGFPNLFPRWLMILIISRDLFIVLVSLIIILMVGWRVFRPTVYGKATTFAQVLTVLGVLFANWHGDVIPELMILFIMTGFLTVLSGLHYLVAGRKYLEIQ